ncbi:hypothetical protein MmTuc01_0716 [Methanosarcina mazei Tuc01]|uniref:Uncharacterized protein n=1 Tax=Methanosarcina mazei Tuc01 TaxID=1236903 RepID=M1P6T9_METMZ|nr:hypothetical protein MmTuc01_0716 [Methanosarcina mazei Tuc01]
MISLNFSLFFPFFLFNLVWIFAFFVPVFLSRFSFAQV